MSDTDTTNINRPKQKPDKNSKVIRQLIDEILDYYDDMSDAEVKRRVVKELSNAQLERRSLLRKQDWAKKNR